MVTRGRIISLVAFLLLFGGMGSVYLFYFKDKLAAYALDEQKAASFEQRYEEMVQAFQQYEPDDLIPAVRGQIPNWQQAVQQRAQYFNFGDWFDFEEPPEGELLRFWYEEEAAEILRESQQAAMEANAWLQYPTDLRTMLNVPTLQELQGREVGEQDVRQYLSNLVFGLSAFDLLVEHGATSIREIQLWPARPQDLLTERTVGLSFTMTMEDLAGLLDELRSSTRYFDVDGLRLQHAYIAQNYEPQLTVDMLLTQARFRQEQSSLAAPGGAPGQPGMNAPGAAPGAATGAAAAEWGRRREQPPPAPEPGFFGKTWTWIKRNIFYTN